MTKAERETYKAEFVTGDYRTLKEFAEAKGIAYGLTRQIAMEDKWHETKREHAKQIADKMQSQDQEKRIQSAQERIDETLKVSSKLREVADKLISKPNITAKEINALASAIYRIKEVEGALLNFGQSDRDTGVDVHIHIADCSEDGGDDNV